MWSIPWTSISLTIGNIPNLLTVSRIKIEDTVLAVFIPGHRRTDKNNNHIKRSSRNAERKGR